MRIQPGATVALAAAALLAAAAPARAADSDPWFGPDKKLHFEISAALAAWTYGAVAVGQISPHAGDRPPDRRLRFALGAAVALSAGVGKELWDLSGHGDASFRDLTWDVIGTASGLALAAAIDWTVTALVRPREAVNP